MDIVKRRSLLALLTLAMVLTSAVWVAANSADGDGWVILFDGTSFDNWVMAGPGHFTIEPDGSMLSHGGMGLFQYAGQTFRDFELELEWKVMKFNDNSGIFVRFPQITGGTSHAINEGYEIQIDNSDSGIANRTGSIYDIQASAKVNTKPLGEWNHYRIQVFGQRYKVWLNGELILDWIGSRGREGYIGIQNHHSGSENYFRNIRARNFPEGSVPAPLTLGEAVAVHEDRDPIRVLVFTGQYGTNVPTVHRLTQILREVEPYTEFEFTITSNAADLNAEHLAGYDVLFFGNTSGNIPLDEAQRQAILDFVASGGGFAGTYSAAATNYDWPEYRELLGGAMILEEAFPEGIMWGVDLMVEEPDNGAVAVLTEGHSQVPNRFAIRDGIYRFDADPRPNVRVLYSLVNESVGKYALSPALAAQPAVVDPPPGDYPLAWCRAYHNGTVFYTSLGSSQHVWGYVYFIEHLLDGLRLAAGRIEGDCTVDPVAVAGSDTWSGQAPLTINFSSAGSFDPNGTPITVHWDFGDGTTSDEPNPTHMYTEVGEYEAVLTVTDGYGRIGQETIRIVVGNTAPEPKIEQPFHGALLPSAVAPLPLRGSAVDAEDGELSGSQLRWVVTAERKVGGIATSEVIATIEGASGEIDTSSLGGWDQPIKFHVELTATDSEGLSNSVTHTVYFSRLQAEGADRIVGFKLEPTTDDNGVMQATASSVGDYLMWKDVNLTNQAVAFLRVAPGQHGSLIHLRIDAPDGPNLVTVPVPGNPAAPDAWTDVFMQLGGVEGVHDLYVVADFGTPDVRINWIQIVGSGTW